MTQPKILIEESQKDALVYVAGYVGKRTVLKGLYWLNALTT